MTRSRSLRQHAGLLPLVLLFVLALPTASPADDKNEKLIPEDTCIVDLNVPEGASVSVDGKDYSGKRELVFDSLQPGQIYGSTITTRVPDGDERTSSLLVRGGWRLALAERVSANIYPELVVQGGHSQQVTAFAFSADQHYLLTGGDDGKLILWDVATGRELRMYGLFGPIQAVTFNSDGERVIAANRRNWGVWDKTTGKHLWTHDLPQAWDSSPVACFTSHGGQLLVGRFLREGTDEKQEYRWEFSLWDVNTGRSLRTYATEPVRGLHLHLTADQEGRSFLSMLDFPDSGSAYVGVWDIRSGRKLWAIPTNRGDYQHARFASLTSSGDKIIIGAQVNSVLDVATGRELHRLGDLRGCLGPASSQGTFLASYDWSKGGRGMEICSTETGDVRFYDIKRPELRPVIFTPDEKSVLLHSASGGSAEPKGNMVLWNLARRKTTVRFGSSLDRLNDIAFNSSDQKLLMGSDSDASLWNLETGRLERTFVSKEGARNCAVAFSHDNERVVAGWSAYSRFWLRVFDISSGRVLTSVNDENNWYDRTDFGLSPDGQRLLATSSFGWELWDPNGADIQSFNVERWTNWRNPEKAIFTRDGHRVLTSESSSFEGTGQKTGAILWDVKTGHLIRQFQREEDVPYYDRRCQAVALSPDERYVLTGDDGKMVILWELESGNRVADFPGHAGAVKAVHFSRDGRYAISSDDKSVILWDIATRRQIRDLDIEGTSVRAVPTADCRRVFTIDREDTASLWDMATGERLARLVSLANGTDWLVVTPEGLFDGSAAGRQKVAYRIGEGLNVVPVDRLFQDFYHPGLLAEIWRGERPMPPEHIHLQSPPSLRIVSPSQGGGTDEPVATVEVEATDQGGGISGPWLSHNGARVSASGQPTQDGKTVRRQFRVTLIEGENRLEAKAASKDGAWESEPASVVLKYEKPLLKPELYLVAVGVNRYAEETLNLKFAVADAKAMSELFAKRGPALYGAGKVHVTQLLDAAATKEGIKNALGELAHKARPQDTLVLLLSGHGTMVGQRYYFLPHDFKPDRNDFEESVRHGGLAGDELDEAVVAVPALKRVLIYDTCQSGGAIGPLRMTRSPFAFQKAIEQMSRSQGSFILAATAAGEEAQESAQLEHGVLTYALLARLGAIDKGPLKDRSGPTDPVVKVRDWCGFAQDEVPDLTKVLFGKKQNVTFKASGNDFPILPTNARP